MKRKREWKDCWSENASFSVDFDMSVLNEKKSCKIQFTAFLGGEGKGREPVCGLGTKMWRWWKDRN